MVRTAAYFEKLPNDAVICRLCPMLCRLAEGKVGICQARRNDRGVLVLTNYGEAVTLAIDPIEKKPLYHYFPGSMILSSGPNSCNLGCLHCQNWSISQEEAATVYLSPERLVRAALEHRTLGVAFTYTEPLMWFEYIRDAAPLLRAHGLKVVLVTNGFVEAEPLEELLGITDAMNVDLKGIREEFYRKVCKGKLQPVLDNIRRIAASDVHLELTNLIIPSENDSEDELVDLIDFVASVSDSIPLHFSAYRPEYKMARAATPAQTLLRAKRLAAGKLKYVYLGNLALPGGGDTTCPNCGNLLVERSGYRSVVRGLADGHCVTCQTDTGIRR